MSSLSPEVVLCASVNLSYGNMSFTGGVPSSFPCERDVANNYESMTQNNKFSYVHCERND